MRKLTTIKLFLHTNLCEALEDAIDNLHGKLENTSMISTEKHTANAAMCLVSELYKPLMMNPIVVYVIRPII